MTTDKGNRYFLKRFIRGYYILDELFDKLPGLFRKENRIETFDELELLWDEANEHASVTNGEETKRYKKEAFLLLQMLKKEERNVSKRISFNWLRYAAVIALLVGVGWGLYRMPDRQTQEAIVYNTVKVVTGEHQTLTLPDGSEVWLNACSKLIIPDHFAGNERRVRLDGEAYFRIVPDPENPFVVETGGMAVKVLGTTFNVKAYSEDEQYSICVESGKVQVDLSDAMVRLLSDEQIVVDRMNGEFIKHHESASRVLSWRKKGLYFNRTPLKTVANDLFRMYGVPVELAAGVDGAIRIIGEHDNANLEAVLKSVCYATGLNYKEESGRILLFR